MPETDLTIRAEWHWVCAIFKYRLPVAMGGLVSETTPGAQKLHIELWEFSGRADLGGGVIVTGHGVGRYKAADITITGQKTTTRIVIQQPEGATHSAELDAIVNEIRDIAAWAREIHRDSQKITAEHLIEQYYRTRAQGAKTTLQQLADEYGFSSTYLREAKRKYDQAGKWGAKPKKKM